MSDIDPLGKKEIRRLAQREGDSLVSIFVPAFQSGNQTEQNPIRFENQLNKAEDVLQKRGLRKEEAEKALKPAKDLLSNPEFWEHQNKGLAVFLSPGFFEYYRIPIEVKETSLVSDKFYIEPLLPLILENGKFYIFSVSKKKAELFQADRYEINKMEVGLPHDIREALETRDPENRVSFHTRTSGKGAVFYGQSPEEEEKKNLLRYFQILDNRLQEAFSSETSPLVLVAVDYFHPLFKKACHYKYLSEEGIFGNPDGMKEGEIHKKSWEIVRPFFQNKEEESKKEYQDLKGGPKTSADPKKVISASREGRVSKLFVNLDEHLWGSDTEIHEEKQEGDSDLCNLASIQTFLNGGDVYVLYSENMPEKSKIAAIFRY